MAKRLTSNTVTQMWRWMFNDVYGVVNEVMLALGLASEP